MLHNNGKCRVGCSMVANQRRDPGIKSLQVIHLPNDSGLRLAAQQLRLLLHKGNLTITQLGNIDLIMSNNKFGPRQ
jgi:hypothetical protein